MVKIVFNSVPLEDVHDKESVTAPVDRVKAFIFELNRWVIEPIKSILSSVLSLRAGWASRTPSSPTTF